MRITFVLPCFDMTGGNRVIATHVEGLQRLGHEVLAVAPAWPRNPLVWRVKQFLKGRGWPPHQNPQGPSHYSVRGIPHRILGPRRPIHPNDLPDADVVVATWWETAEWVADLPASKGAKAYFVQHHEVVFSHLPTDRVEATYRSDTTKLTVAQWLSDLMIDHYGNPPGRVALIPNAVDHNLFHAPPRDKNARPAVGVLYYPVDFKGLDISLRAFELAARRVPGLRLVAFGAVPPNDQYPLPPGTEFHHLPPQDQLKQIYSACDGWLFGSRIEGYGLPLLEAMACRTPPIATPAGAAPELLAEGGGLAVRPEDPEDMAAAIVKLCEMSGDDWRRMSDLAFDMASRHHWDTSTARLERALADVAAGRPAGDPPTNSNAGADA